MPYDPRFFRLSGLKTVISEPVLKTGLEVLNTNIHIHIYIYIYIYIIYLFIYFYIYKLMSPSGLL